MSRSSTLAVKALNQYRKRDVISYIGLRYYLNNSSSKKCRWIRDVASRLAIKGNTQAYLKTSHFKEIGENGDISYRDIYLPAPNEALSEVALLTELSKYSKFHPKPYVYSYRFADENEQNGVFLPYFTGLKERQKDIASACWDVEGGIVLITDIKKFYPSISAQDAFDTWNEFSSKTNLPNKFKLLGNKLLSKHKRISLMDNSANGILTGPIFSHVVANLLLDSLDLKMNELTNGKYFRYVDDITFVGTPSDCHKWREILSNNLSELGLELHTGEKDFEVSCDEWLEGEHDFETKVDSGWMSFIADTKRFLIAQPERSKDLAQAFLLNDIKLPVLDYSQLAHESSNLEKFQDWMLKYKWSFKAVKNIDVDYLVLSAMNCKNALLKELDTVLDQPIGDSLYQRKRLIPKLRYIIGRLVIFAESELLHRLVDKLQNIPELTLLSATMRAVATRDVTEIVQMGTNAAQVTAQLLKVSDEKVEFDATKVNIDNKELIDQSLAVLSFNQINYAFDGDSSELRQLAKEEGMFDLMSSSNEFIKEMACLHGMNDSLNATLMTTVFDRNEDLALDIINQLQQSRHA